MSAYFPSKLIYPETQGHNPADFLYPKPSLKQRLLDALGVASIQALPTAYVKSTDWSYYQEEREVNYQEVYAGNYRLVIIKATEGTSYVDPVFQIRWPRLLDAGFYVMVYHFFHSHLSGELQAEFFLETTQKMREAFLGRVAGWNDIENRAGLPTVSITDRRARARAFHGVVKTNMIKDGAYSSPSLWQSLMGNDQLSYYGDGWLAHWTAATAPTLPVGWTEAATRLWQTGVYPTYSWVEPVPGVQGTVDVDRWFGTEQTLRDYLGYTETPPPAPSTLHLPIVFYKPIEGEASVLARFDRTYNSAKKPMMEIYPGDTLPVGDRIHLSGEFRCTPWLVTGDGGIQYVAIAEPKYYAGLDERITLYARLADVVPVNS